MAELGAFSVSLAVKDLRASFSFYEKLGFKQVGGNFEENWLILRSGGTTLGLFQGMFPQNLLTFNPGWDEQAEELSEFEDIRALAARLRSAGVEVATVLPESGPASFFIEDPDGNQILVDQHVERPQKP